MLFVASKFRSLVVTDLSGLWVSENLCPDFLWQLAVDITVARNTKNFELEEQLYNYLLHLLRSPERLLAVAGSQERESSESLDRTEFIDRTS